MNVLHRIAPILLPALSAATLLVSIIGFAVARIQEDAAKGLYDVVSFGDAGYQDAQDAWISASEAVNAWGSWILVGAIGVLLTLVVYSLRPAPAQAQAAHESE